jgi:hypothetical protein
MVLFLISQYQLQQAKQNFHKALKLARENSEGWEETLKEIHEILTPKQS